MTDHQGKSCTKGDMFSMQSALPKFPVAPLQETLEKYLKIVKPLLDKLEFETTKKLADWWLRANYLEYRLPIPIHSSAGVMFPRAHFTSVDDQLRYAAALISGMLSFKKKIDDETLPVDYMGKNPLCMMLYLQMFSACRVPGINRDEWIRFPSVNPDAPSHITVVYRNTFYSLEVYGTNGQPLNIRQLLNQLKWICDRTKTFSPAVGLLTMNHRDRWAQIYQKIVADPVNKFSIDEIQKSIFVLCIDESLPHDTDQDNQNCAALFHGGGSRANSANRWFDKTIQLIVGANGYSGINYEHLPVDATHVIHLTEHCLNFIQADGDTSSSAVVANPRKLEFSIGPDLLSEIEETTIRVDIQVSDFDLKVLIFTDFGKEHLKSMNISPGGFIQLAIQLAYYRIHKKTCSSYQSASLRKFQLGRSDKLTSCSVESVEFSQAMLNVNEPLSRKAELLRRAVQTHVEKANEVMNGKGVSGHLLGLKIAALEDNQDVPEFFTNSSFRASDTWIIAAESLSTKSKSILVFGPVAPAGYAIGYTPNDNELLISVTSFKDNKGSLSSGQMANAIRNSLLDMSTVLETARHSSL